MAKRRRRSAIDSAVGDDYLDSLDPEDRPKKKYKGAKSVKFDVKRRASYAAATKLAHAYQRGVGGAKRKAARSQAAVLLKSARKLIHKGYTTTASRPHEGAFGRSWKDYSGFVKTGRNKAKRTASVHKTGTYVRTSASASVRKAWATRKKKYGASGRGGGAGKRRGGRKR